MSRCLKQSDHAENGWWYGEGHIDHVESWLVTLSELGRR